MFGGGGEWQKIRIVEAFAGRGQGLYAENVCKKIIRSYFSVIFKIFLDLLNQYKVYKIYVFIL